LGGLRLRRGKGREERGGERKGGEGRGGEGGEGNGGKGGEGKGHEPPPTIWRKFTPMVPPPPSNPGYATVIYLRQRARIGH